MRKPLIIASALSIITLAAGTAAAATVYLNGVDITSVRNKTFKNATVRIDGDGNVHIDAPGYKVEVKPQSESKTEKKPKKKEEEGGPNPQLDNHYYLVTQPSAGGRAQYDFIVTINGVEKKVIEAGSSQVILEISTWLKPGPNEIRLTASKRLESGRKSTSEADEARLIVGRGHVENKIVKIDGILTSLTADASQVDTRQKTFTLRAE